MSGKPSLNGTFSIQVVNVVLQYQSQKANMDNYFIWALYMHGPCADYMRGTGLLWNVGSKGHRTKAQTTNLTNTIHMVVSLTWWYP